MANYLYNGVEFPPLPETTHQYMYIWNSSALYAEELVTTPKPYYDYLESTGKQYIGCQAGDASYYYYDDYTDWTFNKEYTSTFRMCGLDSVLWANFDVVDENGNVVLPASYPIDAETGEEITIYGLYKNSKTYLYNGVALPPLPESENTYVFVMKEDVTFGITHHDVYFTPETYFGHSSTGNWYIGSRAGGHTHSCIIDNVGSGAYDPSVWSSGVDYENDIFIDSIDEVLWSNFDVVDENGNVVLPASYPIDSETGEEITIYGLYGIREAPPIPPIPTAITLGFQTGTAIRLMRGLIHN